MTSALESLTLGVRDLEAALAPLRDVLGYRIESDTRASVNLLSAWQHRVHARVRLVELSCAGYPFGRIRLAHYSPPPTVATRVENDSPDADRATDTGPKAFDLFVAPPLEAVAERLSAAGVAARTPPLRYRAGDAQFEECLFDGPEGVPMLLKLPHGAARSTLRAPPTEGRAGEVATVAIVVADPQASRRFYAEGLDLIVGETIPVTAGALAQASSAVLGVPSGTSISLTRVRDRQQPSGKLMFVHFPDVPKRPLRRPMRPGQLGFNLFSLRSADLDALEARLRPLEADIVTRPTHVAIGNGLPARVMLVRGPDGELLEFLERES